jgi:PEP-CTERM motif
LKPTLRNAAISVLLATGFAASASAGTLTFQGVTFTSSWTGNVLTLEIDAAHPTGDWASATTIGALQLKDIGSFDSVSLTAAPGSAINWTLSSNELSANGCTGGAHLGTGACYSGAHVALADDMTFQFTFTGGSPDFTSPHLKVNFFNEDGAQKVGSLLSMNIPAAPVPEPQTYAMLLGGLAAGALARRRKLAKR